MKLLIDERGSGVAEDAIRGTQTSAASQLAYVEVSSALARMAAGGRLSKRAFQTAADEFADRWDEVAVVEVNDRVIADAADLARRYRLRAYDAVHLASALFVKREGDVGFACWDVALRDAATAEGLDLIPTEV